jgi:hypothetical protein
MNEKNHLGWCHIHHRNIVVGYRRGLLTVVFARMGNTRALRENWSAVLHLRGSLNLAHPDCPFTQIFTLRSPMTGDP